MTGCVGINADGTYAKTVGEQTARSLAIIRAAIEALGGKLEHVIRTRMYVVDVSKWEEVARVHGSVFSEIRPATTIVEVARLIDGERSSKSRPTRSWPNLRQTSSAATDAV